MKEDVYKKLFEFLKDESLELPYGLTLDKIANRGSNFRETVEGKIKFELERHPSLFGRPPVTEGGGSSARWHELTSYTYDPRSQEWEATIIDVELLYEPWLMEEEEMISLSDIIYDILEEEDQNIREEMRSQAISNIIQYYEEQRENLIHPISDEKWNEMLQILEERLDSRLKKEITSSQNKTIDTFKYRWN